ncbi:MAG: DUF72 domain-containing protein [Planctomycetota bacterium]
MAAKKGTFRVGTSGWQYDHWTGVFYPEERRKAEWFGHFSEHFDTVEVNNTFYHLPSEETFDNWAHQAPAGFLYVLKFSRYGSHIKKLKDPADSIGLFLERAERLGDHLGPILVQLPPGWNPNPDRLAAFLEAAPARRRWAMEFRNPDWLCEEIFTILREHNVALCIHDLIDDHPREVTADWIYLRFHGADDGGEYSHQALSASARRIESWRADGLDVYAYFNNDAHGYAIENATDLRRYVESR